ncbi:MAG: PEP-CTERM sorting domain-containing protein [Betaproteobacteria bacterium]|nr:PEP-CTERM sorting domain-containing protein [Betaproteobacteria bacterium]
MVFAGAAHATPVRTTLYFTTYNGGGPDVWKTTATYAGNGTAGNGTFSPGTATNIAITPGADGIVLNPNNKRLLVGGQGTGQIYQVNPNNGAYTALNAGMNAYEVTVDPNNDVVWGGGSEGGAVTFTSVPINPPGGAPTVATAHMASGAPISITHLTFAPGQAAGTAFYTSGGDGGGGSFGTIDLATGLVTPIFTNVQYAHGMVYDPFTGDLIISGGNELAQINPTTDAVVSTGLFGTDVLDQGAVDGNGNLYWADNNGNLLYVNYSTTKLIGSPSNFVSNNFYMSQLDDFAPLVGAGGTNNHTTVPEPATLALMGLGFAGLSWARRRKS